MGGDGRENADNGENNGSATESSAVETRIYVGGLGNAVTADDIRHTFSSLGNVKSVEIVRTKGRSLAYLDFLPSSPKSLAKLFSMYNGCVWKGGRLRLEKAKENYLLRLRKEWEEDAKLANSAPGSAVAAAETSDSPVKFKKDSLNLEKKELRVFFPKLRSVKLLPFKGSGKHKYSFQRVEVPPLPRHFCDCEEHSHPDPIPERKDISNLETQDGGIDEKELNIMNSVMKKLFERNNKTASAGVELVKEDSRGAESVDDQVNDGSETDQSSDEDNLVMNLVSGGKNRKSTTVDDEEELIDALRSSNDRLSLNQHKSQRQNIISFDQKKISPLADGSEDTALTDEDNTTTNSVDDLLDDEEMDDMTDDDNLVMNFVTGGSKKATILGSKDDKTSFRNEVVTFDEPRPSKDNNERFQKKRKSPLVKITDGKEQAPVNLEKKEKAKKTCLENSTKETSTNHSLPQKSSWKALVGGRSNPSFSISHIIQSSISDESKPDSVDIPISSHYINQKPEDSSSVSVLKSQKKSNEPSQNKRKSPLGETTDGQEQAPPNLDRRGKAKKTHLGKSTQETSTDHPLSENSKDPVGERSNPSSSISHTTQNTISEEEAKPDSVDFPISSHHQNQKPEEDTEPPLQPSSSKGPKVVAVSQPNESNATTDKYARGDYWRQKSSWTQLVSQSNSSFSITQILPGTTFEKLQHPEPVVANAQTSTVTEDNNSVRSGDLASVNAPGSSNMFALASGPYSKPASPGKDLQTSEEADDFAAQKKEVVKAKRLPIIDSPIGETCTFMRSAASMKEWMSTRTALSASLKKKENQK